MAESPGSESGWRGLDPCVHCGFCLPACPTYLATSDESDSPRGRIVLMRGLETGEIAPTDGALRAHLDACLGCRGCEPACPSGVSYGRALETVRAHLAQVNGLPLFVRSILRVFRHTVLWRSLFSTIRWFRATGLPARLSGSNGMGFAFGMLASTSETAADGAMSKPAAPTRDVEPQVATRPGDGARTVALFRGCVMDTLFGHIHEATKRTLEANGYRVVEMPGQTCCGALHDHAGAKQEAKVLARKNLSSFPGVDFIAVNSAGCGALLKEYGQLLGTDASHRFAVRVRDVTELLAAAGPRVGAAVELDVAYDAPCHLQHAQRIHAPPLQVLRSIPGLRVRILPGSDQCCGSAGIFGVVHPDLSRAVLAPKIGSFRDATPILRYVLSGNPGCLMQIGAGLRAAGLSTEVAHPVEVLDWSYRKAGFYGRP